MIIRFDSETSCRQAYIDYYTNEHTSVTKEDMRKIVQRYDEKTRQAWQRAFEASCNDDNRYEFDDEEFESIRTESYNDTEEEYGEDVNVKAEKARVVGEASGTALSAAGTAGNALVSSGKFGLNNIDVGKEMFTGKWANFGKGNGFQLKLGDIMTAVACVMTFIVGLGYKLNKANEEEINAVNDLYGEMENQQDIIVDDYENLQDLQKDIEKASDEASDANEEANDEIETKASEHMGYTNTYNVLQAKINSGQQLSASEIQLYKGIVSIMNSTAGEIKSSSEKADKVLKTNQENISGFVDDFDDVAVNIASVQGVTDYAAEIDEATQKSCQTEAIMHGINAASGAMSAIKAAGNVIKNICTWPIAIIWGVLAGLAGTGAVFSLQAMKEQNEFAKQAGEEVTLRVDTQEANTDLNENYEEGVDTYNTTKAAIDTYTVNKPNELVVPTKSSPNPFNNGDNDDDDNKRPTYLT